MKADRQIQMLKEFNFTCECEACDKNYPSPPNLANKDIKLLKFAKKTEHEIMQLKPNQALKRYGDCCEALNNKNNSYPSLEMSMLQKCMAMFLLRQAQPSVLFP